MAEDKKNTLNTPQSTKPLFTQIKPQIPQFNQFRKPIFKGPNFSSNTAFRNQNRGSGGK